MKYLEDINNFVYVCIFHKTVKNSLNCGFAEYNNVHMGKH